MNGKSKVAIIDDEADMRESVAQWLQLSGFEPIAFEAAEPALKVLGPDFAGVVISDIRMPGHGRHGAAAPAAGRSTPACR